MKLSLPVALLLILTAAVVGYFIGRSTTNELYTFTGEKSVVGNQIAKTLNSMSEKDLEAFKASSVFGLRTPSTPPPPQRIRLDTGYKMIARYRELMKTQVITFVNNTTIASNKTMFELIHKNLCPPGENSNTYLPSYRVPYKALDSIRNNNGNAKIAWFVFYPAINANGNFTLVLGGAENSANLNENGKEVHLEKKEKTAEPRENQIWDFVQPCPPPVGCNNLAMKRQ